MTRSRSVKVLLPTRLTSAERLPGVHRTMGTFTGGVRPGPPHASYRPNLAPTSPGISVVVCGRVWTRPGHVASLSPCSGCCTTSFRDGCCRCIGRVKDPRVTPPSPDTPLGRPLGGAPRPAFVHARCARLPGRTEVTPRVRGRPQATFVVPPART